VAAYWRQVARLIGKEIIMRNVMNALGMAALIVALLVSSAAARGAGASAPGGGRPAGGPASTPPPPSNAGGTVRGLERAEDVASPQGQKGIEKAEQKIDKKENSRNPNTETKEDTDTTKKTPPRK
jgi:hypothetical protein